jgi:Lar family restriction alleviation protein
MTDELMALLPCPFCGGEAEVIWYDGFPCIRCKTYDCGCGTGMHSSGGEAKAIAAWNRRTELPALIAERDALREALAPSADTKAAYIGEFHFNVIDRDEDGEEVPRRVAVPWDVTKEIMAAISARAALAGQP